jgi:hypothetical protein
MRAEQERDEVRQMDSLHGNGDTEEPQTHITTMVVYLGVGKLADDRDTAAEDPASGGQDNAYGGTPGVTEDASSISSR